MEIDEFYDFFEYLERAEQERDVIEYEKRVAYDQGWNDGINEFLHKIELKYIGVHPDELYDRHYAYDIVNDIKKIADNIKGGY